MPDELLDCKQRVADLEIQNEELRASAQAFGALAERLNQELQAERRGGAERRVVLRPTPDRRGDRGQPQLSDS